MVARRTLPFDPIAEAVHNWELNGWEAAAPGMSMVTSIMRAHQILLARVHHVLEPFDLTFAQYEALMLLSFTRTGKMPLGKIGHRLQVHPASVTNVIDRLEAKELVRRVPHPVDLRATLAAITRRGRSRAARSTVALNVGVFEDIGIDRIDQQAVFDLIAGLRRSAGDFDPDPSAGQ